jgi:hypothetical protein
MVILKLAYMLKREVLTVSRLRVTAHSFELWEKGGIENKGPKPVPQGGTKMPGCEFKSYHSSGNQQLAFQQAGFETFCTPLV